MRTTTELTRTFGERLAKARKLAGLDQAGMAVRLGIGRRTITRYEGDLSVPSEAVVIAWSVITEAPLEWLKTGAVTESDTHGYGRPWDVELPLWDEAA